MSEYVDLQPDVHDVQLLLLHVAPVDLLRQAPSPRDPAPATPRRRAASPRTWPRPRRVRRVRRIAGGGAGGGGGGAHGESTAAPGVPGGG